MAQNEMTAKPALPERVRSMEGLGDAGRAAALALATETLAEPERRGTLCIGVVFTTGSVPEQGPIRHRLCVPKLARCPFAGERPAAGRAATTRLPPSFLSVPAMALPTEVAVLCSTDFPVRGSEENS